MKRPVFVALLLAFVLPPLMAYFAFNQGWLQGGITNNGNLLPPGVQVNSGPRGHWQILVIPANGCDERCQNATFVAGQTHQALGREADRVELALAWSSQIAEMPDIDTRWHIWPLKQQDNPRLREAEATQLYLVDPAGNVVLSYPAKADRDEMIATGRGLLKDLKRLLKYSQMG